MPFQERVSYFNGQNIFAIDQDVVHSIDITSEKAIYGTEKVVIAKTKLGGRSFKLTIPAGTKDGTSCLLQSEGRGNVILKDCEEENRLCQFMSIIVRIVEKNLK